MRDIAKAAEVSVATVSLALRSHPSIPEKTRKRIRQVAASLGYQPNPRVTELMNHIRKNRDVGNLSESVALIWMDVTQQEVDEEAHLLDFVSGARSSLIDNGFGLECFYQDPEVAPERLEKIIKARGIRGIILAPLMHTPAMILHWNWSHFSALIAGSAVWEPTFHRVQFHHFAEMVTMLHHLQDAGKKRIGLVVDSSLDDRSQHAITGGFWAGLETDIPKRDAFFDPHTEGHKGFSSWLETYRPDCLIVGHAPELKWIREKAPELPLVLRSVTGSLESAQLPGIRQDYARLGLVSAEQLIGHLLRNEVGVPSNPLQTLITGEWMDGTTVLNKASMKRKD